MEGDVYVATWQPENAKKVTITASYGGGDRFNGATSISINYQPNLAQQSFTVKTNDDEQTPIEKLELHTPMEAQQQHIYYQQIHYQKMNNRKDTLSFHQIFPSL